jgi:hypothetical protein
MVCFEKGLLFFVTPQTKAGILTGLSQEAVATISLFIFGTLIVRVERIPLVAVVTAGTEDCASTVSAAGF